MVSKTPLFPGDSEIDQLFKIFQVLGTPTDEVWPGVSQFPDFKPTFPKWRPKDLAASVKGLDPLGADLMARMLAWEPGRRISAKEALQHPYFNDLNEALSRTGK
jgi:serine/threonine protein kinase